jgi:hypothetical protein
MAKSASEKTDFQWRNPPVNNPNSQWRNPPVLSKSAKHLSPSEPEPVREPEPVHGIGHNAGPPLDDLKIPEFLRREAKTE